jgi:hypothetical protein
LKQGANTIALTMSGNGSNGGFMYDCIKLEAGEPVTSVSNATRLNDKGRMQNSQFYNLHGQRVTNPAKGLYIVNGKKVIFK